ncbi:TPA: polysaccharide deacetylase family protein [Clostridioides difficile]|uniref:polysaccharide deacetylase family protein n=1 Tax=Clostridioides difficile TaxID=1496 RepID=UPI000D1F3536|nr:polysaccharide deacetylase family protein [Clostridioides difficile]UWD41287.1 polysaccharide deacetylase family protein [Clostridioides difficile]VIF80688.1 polysaccharide deacetylase [Clostridioides difficile]HBE9438021.1 polysaccharide deacetylase family protein [Clostridioides difficile]HBF4771162.1 polysaccharide deacetylase family protein [Clostridioides difficile]HBF5036192.1 polysaccharide deacetylase family protein [Clostridioides difficile]
MKREVKRTKALIYSVLFFSLLLVLIFVFVYGIKYICSKSDNSKMPIYKVDTNEKKIALSFDVAWGTDNMDDILKILDKHNVKATFFLVGSWVDDNEEIVKAIDEKGHEIGNHSNTHANLKEISKEDITKEIETTSEKIYNITGKKTNLFRPPFGDVNNKAMGICSDLGYKVIKWDVDSIDWKELGPNHVIEKVIKESRPGSIVLFHANINDVDNYLDTIISRLKKDGYSLVKISDLLYKDNYVVDSNGVQKTKN